MAGGSGCILTKQPASIAISDDENSDSGDFAVTSDILPKPKGRGRKPIKKEEEVEDVEEDDDVADTKVTNGDADEDGEEEEDDEEDMDEDE